MGKTVQAVLPSYDPCWIDRYTQVAQSGESARFEQYIPRRETWVEVYASRVGGGGSRLVACVLDDVTARKRAEEGRAFMLKLSDALRSSSDPEAIKAQAARALGEHCGVTRALYVEVDEGAGKCWVSRDYHSAGLPSVAGEVPLAEDG